MIIPAKAKMDFIKKSDKFLRAFIAVVLLKMTGNALYPASVTLVALVQELFDQYVALLGNAAYRDPAVIQQKNDVKQLLENKLRELCNMVNYLTPYNRSALLTTGFNITPETKTNKVTEPFKKFWAKNLVMKGDVKVQVVRGAGTQNVLFFYAVAATLAEVTTWTPCPGSGSSCILTNQVSASNIFFKATAVGPRGQMYVSNVISLVVL
jgi:hydroxymethylpyrimidine/phosphomethylpyrimidine kinase